MILVFYTGKRPFLSRCVNIKEDQKRRNLRKENSMPEWDILQAIYHARVPAMRAYHKTPSPLQTLLDEFKVPPHLIGEMIYMAENYNTFAMSADHYMRRNCYYHPGTIEHTLTELSDSGLFESTNEAGTYCISDKGKHFIERSEELVLPRWVMPPVENEHLMQAITLLRRTVAATRVGNLPCDTWSVQTRAEFGRPLNADTPPMWHLHVTTFDLWAYRDDAHLAAWRLPYPDLAPRTWEALSVLWRKEAKDAATLAEALKDHGFSADDYAESLNELAARGWVEERDGEYTLTPEGEKVRQRAEILTDEYFYTVFSTLSAAERTELNTSLENLLAGLKEMAAQTSS
jgi:predicted transcriptional regulator